MKIIRKFLIILTLIKNLIIGSIVSKSKHKLHFRYKYDGFKRWYYDWDKDDYVRFVDIEEDVVNYYLYFHVGDKTFHSPIKMDINKFIRNNGFQQLKIIDLPEDFYTQGKNTNSLLSVQFCDKVYERFISQAG